MLPPGKSVDLAIRHYRAGRRTEARAVCHEILSTNPDQSHALHLLGILCFEQQKWPDAIRYVRRALEIDDVNSNFWNDLGLMYLAVGDSKQGVACLRRASQLCPADLEILASLAEALKLEQHFEEALGAYERILLRKPEDATVHAEIGRIFGHQRRFTEAMTHLAEAQSLRPDDASVHNDLGWVRQRQGEIGEAIVCFQAALRLQPDFAIAHANLGAALNQLGRLSEAVAEYRQAVRYAPDNVTAYNNLGNDLLKLGDISAATAAYREAIRLKPDFAVAHSNLLFCLNYDPNYEGPALFAEHLKWAQQHAARWTRLLPPCVTDRSPERRLRVGYVSADFHFHPAMTFVEPILASHSRDGFEVFCYANVLRPDNCTDRVRRLVDRWRDIHDEDDEQVAELVRKDKIDILVDLNGHCAGNRLLVFARRPAPVQVSMPVYPNTTGLAAIDYRITDDKVDPIGETERFYAETLVRLPHIFACYQPPPEAPPVGELPALAAQRITFGSFNHRPKISTQVIAVWSTILRRVPDSRLILHNVFAEALGGPDNFRDPILSVFEEQGIEAARIELVGPLPFRQHLDLFNRADLALDTFPRNGMTTTFEALWMGIPVVVLNGDRHASRVGVSLLSSSGLTDFIADSMNEYAEIAVRTASDVHYLSHLRAGLRERMAQSVLTDVTAYTRSLERAYRWMWRRCCAQSER